MAFDKVDENTVYSCTGQPQPDDIRLIVETMLTQPFNEAYESNLCTCMYVFLKMFSFKFFSYT